MSRSLLVLAVAIGVAVAEVDKSTLETKPLTSLPAVISVTSQDDTFPDIGLDTNFALKGNLRVFADEEFQYRCIELINRKRYLHESTPQLILGANFTGYTIERANDIVRDIENKRDIAKGRHPFGESFFWYYDPRNYRSLDDAVNTWYDEYKNYDYNNPRFSAKTGSFSQLVWKGSREATCIKVEYQSQGSYKTLVVANFWPAGNVAGEFPYNVLPLKRNRPDYDSDRRPGNRPNRPSRPSRPDYERPPYDRPPNRPSRPDYERPPNRPSRPDYERPPNRPSRPDYERPPYEPPNRPSRPDYERPPYDRPPNRPSRPDYERPPSRPSRPDYERPPNRPSRPDYDRPTRPDDYPTHPISTDPIEESTLLKDSNKIEPKNQKQQKPKIKPYKKTDN